MKELELILNTITQLGAAGKEAFIWWLIFDKLLYVVGWLATVGTIVYGIVRTVTTATFATEIRDRMGIGSPGPLIESEKNEIREWIEKRRDR